MVPMPFAVVPVLSLPSPAQIRDYVVGRIAVEVPTLLVRDRCPVKSRQNESMNKLTSRLAITVEHDALVAVVADKRCHF